MAKDPVILGIANSSSMGWAASQIYMDDEAVQQLRDDQHHLYFIVVGPHLSPVALTGAPDMDGWILAIAYGTPDGLETATVRVPKRTFPRESLSLVNGVLIVSSDANAEQPRFIAPAEVVRAALKAQDTSAKTPPAPGYTGLHVYFDASKSTEIPQSMTLFSAGESAAGRADPREDWVHQVVENLFTFDVVYIGQSYGDEGALKAIDRLRKHSKAQQALGQVQDFHPNQSVGFITIDQEMKFVDTHIDTTQGYPDEATLREFAAEHFPRLDEPLSKTTVDVAEAVLIGSFKPRLNKNLINFSNENRAVKEVRAMGYTHLQVRINLRGAFAKLRGPQTGKPSADHSWTFNLETGEQDNPGDTAWNRYHTGH